MTLFPIPRSLFQHSGIQFLRLFQLCVAVGIFFYAGLSPFDPNQHPTLPPTALHLIGNFLLMCSLWLALVFRLPFYALVLTAIVLSVGCEMSQSFTQSRHTNAWDFFCNLVGIGIGAVLCYIFQRFAIARDEACVNHR